MKKNDVMPIIHLQQMPNGGSDVTLKKDITDIEDALDKILSLRPVTWYWKEDTQNSELNYGFIAQEVEQVLPHLVSEDTWKDGSTRRFLSTNNMLPYVIYAIKEQQAQIDELRELVHEIRKTNRK